MADLSGLTILASRGTLLSPGDVRLVGWIDGFLPGVQVEPGASQTASQGVVLVHLRHGLLPDPVPDVNVAADVRAVADEKLESLETFPDMQEQFR
jgi:hypothetical protein